MAKIHFSNVVWTHVMTHGEWKNMGLARRKKLLTYLKSEPWKKATKCRLLKFRSRAEYESLVCADFIEKVPTCIPAVIIVAFRK